MYLPTFSAVQDIYSFTRYTISTNKSMHYLVYNCDYESHVIVIAIVIVIVVVLLTIYLLSNWAVIVYNRAQCSSTIMCTNIVTFLDVFVGTV